MDNVCKNVNFENSINNKVKLDNKALDNTIDKYSNKNLILNIKENNVKNYKEKDIPFINDLKIIPNKYIIKSK